MTMASLMPLAAPGGARLLVSRGSWAPPTAGPPTWHLASHGICRGAAPAPPARTVAAAAKGKRGGKSGGGTSRQLSTPLKPSSLEPELDLTKVGLFAVDKESLSRVRFTLHYDTELGERLVLVGSAESMGAWKLDASPKMEWVNNGTWQLELSVPDGDVYEYKYVVMQENHEGTLAPTKWQQGSNQMVVVPRGGVAGRMSVEDIWDGSTRSILGDVHSLIEDAAIELGGSSAALLKQRVEQMTKEIKDRKARELDLMTHQQQLLSEVGSWKRVAAEATEAVEDAAAAKAASEADLSRELTTWKNKAIMASEVKCELLAKEADLKAEIFSWKAKALNAQEALDAAKDDCDAGAAAVTVEAAAGGQGPPAVWAAEKDELVLRVEESEAKEEALREEVARLTRAVRILKEQNRALAESRADAGIGPTTSKPSKPKPSMEDTIKSMSDLVSGRVHFIGENPVKPQFSEILQQNLKGKNGVPA